MAEDESVAGEGKKRKRTDHTEVEFEFGNIEFEAKGRSVVVERMFRLLLDKIETGSLVASFELQDIEDEDEEGEESEESEEEEPEEEVLPETELSEGVLKEDTIVSEENIEPPPSWDSLETEEPEVSDAEKEELDLE